MTILDTQRPYIKLDKEKDPDYVEQDALIHAWSESNINYELAWWFYPEADDRAETSLIKHLRATRPLPPNVSPEARAKLSNVYKEAA
jgi:hypothetical protein